MPEPITDDQRDLASEVREALAKATPFGLSGRKSTESYRLIANAPEWLAELCNQVERLTRERDAAYVLHDFEIKSGRECCPCGVAADKAIARAEKAEAAVDIAASIIDDARHALAPERPGPRIEPAKRVLWSEDAHKIVTAWADRKRIASCHIPPRLGQRHALDGE